jgi:hypothetical protein
MPTLGTATIRNPPREYSNIWLVRFDASGRCREFKEWYVARRGT